MTSFIKEFEIVLNKPSDIYQHLPLLWQYSTECYKILECGVRTPTSTWAFVQGLIDNSNKNKTLVSVDLNTCPGENYINEVCQRGGVSFTFIKENDLKLDLKKLGKFDMTFIDTWHIYGHLKRELEYFCDNTNKYIILHDTTVDGIKGETIRNGWDAKKQSQESGYPVEEITKGLWPAVEEFLKKHTEWKLHARFNHCHGLTVLKRVI